MSEPDKVRKLCEICGLLCAGVGGTFPCEGPEYYKFNTADMYTCDDCAEYLTHTDFDECLGDFLDNTWELSRSVEENLDEIGEVEMFGYKRKELRESWTRDMVSRFLDELRDADGMAESWWEEYGDIDGDCPPLDNAKAEDIKELEDALVAVLHPALVKSSHVWQCEVVAKRIYARADIIEHMRVNSPEVLEEKPDGR